MKLLLQSWRSDRCLVYSTAMLLGLHGAPVDRLLASAWFGAGDEPPMLDEARVIVSSILGVRARWGWFATPADACRWLARTRPPPTLLALRAVHPRTRERCGHCVVALSARRGKVALADPLARGARAPNASIWPSASDRVDGAGWLILRRAPTAVLCFP